MKQMAKTASTGGDTHGVSLEPTRRAGVLTPGS